MGGAGRGRTYYWDRHTDGDGRWRGKDRPAGEELAALRCGLGREAGDAPQMWPFYRSFDEQGHRTHDLAAEHLALTLFAVHQQGKDRPVHQAGVGLGTAMLALRRSGKYSPDAIDRRFSAAATATGLTELAGHLRGLITQMRAAGRNGSEHALDYTRLTLDLRDWQLPGRAAAIRRQWGSQYFAPRPEQPASGYAAADATPGI